MRRTIRILSVAGVLCLGASADAQSPYYGTQTVQVAVNQSWTDTGLDLTAGDRVIIAAWGTVAGSAVVPGTNQWVGPDGAGGNCQDPYKPFPFALERLVGRINVDGTVFDVGSFKGINVDASGRLYLGINDGFPEDATGFFVAVIYVVSCGSAAVGPEHSGSGLGLVSYPNPAGHAATVAFALENSGLVDLRVYDPSGRQVRAIVATRFGPGDHAVTWDGRDDRGIDVAPGVYFYDLRVDGHKEGNQKTIVLK